MKGQERLGLLCKTRSYLIKKLFTFWFYLCHENMRGYKNFMFFIDSLFDLFF